MKLRFALGSLLLGSLLGIVSWGAAAQTFTTLHSFTARPDSVSNSDGAGPLAQLILSGGTLYGTASGGGNSGGGTVFRVNTDGTGFTNLHSFSARTNNSGNSDGFYPYGGLILSGSTLYGTASEGGSSNGGTVYRVNTDGTGFTNLHSFTAGSNFPPYGNSDGRHPYGGLVLSGNTLYGTAHGGGSSANGTVFSLNTDGTGFTTLYSFTETPAYPNPSVNSDGAQPYAGLVLSGNTLFGTAWSGGSSGVGTVFRLNTDGTGFSTLYSFAAGSGSWNNYTNSDGAYPYAGLILSGHTLYGTAWSGGSSGGGTVFSINTDGTGFTNLYSFSAGSGSHPGSGNHYTNSDGAHSYAGLFLSGNTLYGAAASGGSSGGGTVFRVNTDGTDFTALYSFTASPCYTCPNSNGALPYAGLILSGNTLYGAAELGGSSGSGALFSLSLGTAIPPQLAVTRLAGNAILAWPTNATGYVLQSATTLANGGDWQDSSLTPTDTNGQKVITVSTTNSSGFFRLRQP